MTFLRPALLSIALVALPFVGSRVVVADAGHGHGHGSASIGVPGDPVKATRTVVIGMDDSMRFTPSSVDARRGETIRFVLRNAGKVRHEMVLGTRSELEEHAALMRRFPGMEHADANQASVEPGATGEIVWRFTRSGRVDFGCLQPGHYEAGMKGRVSVR